jgi:hypothetical protein
LYRAGSEAEARHDPGHCDRAGCGSQGRYQYARTLGAPDARKQPVTGGNSGTGDDLYGTGDTIVAPAVVHAFAQRACALGKTVSYKLVQGGEHATVARLEAQATPNWIDARFAGQRAPDTCRK